MWGGGKLCKWTGKYGGANIVVDWKVGEQRLEVNWKVCVRADKQKKKKERKQVIWLQTFLSLGLLVSAHHIAFSKFLPKKSEGGKTMF
jgi:hypothetical protein